MIIDASVLLSAFFPDEAQPQAQAILRAHVAGDGRLKAPQLLAYEAGNAVWQAERRGRISSAQAAEILETMAGLELELLALDWGEMLPMARTFQCSAYDAAYLALADRLGEKFVTADKRLYDAVRRSLDWVVWMGEILPGKESPG